MRSRRPVRFRLPWPRHALHSVHRCEVIELVEVVLAAPTHLRQPGRPHDQCVARPCSDVPLPESLHVDHGCLRFPLRRQVKNRPGTCCFIHLELSFPAGANRGPKAARRTTGPSDHHASNIGRESSRLSRNPRSAQNSPAQFLRLRPRQRNDVPNSAKALRAPPASVPRSPDRSNPLPARCPRPCRLPRPRQEAWPQHSAQSCPFAGHDPRR